MDTKQKAARDVVVGDVVLNQFGGRGEVTQRDGHTTPGVVYFWFDGHESPPADLMLNHGDPVKVEVPARNLKFTLELEFSMTDMSAQDIIESALRDALDGIAADGLELETPHRIETQDGLIGSWGVDHA